jgi:mRNA interferase RelE/StbE
MASYHVVLTSSTEKELKKLPSRLITRIISRLENLSFDPRPPGCKKLIGGDREWRIRVGDYRAVYTSTTQNLWWR